MIRKSQLNLVPHSDAILHTPPKEFDFQGSIEADMLANMMLDRMQELGGIGLSANQVGLNIKMFVMGFEDIKMAIFNPEILEQDGEEVQDEGCLSFPGIFVKVKRPAAIKVRFFNVKGEERQEYITGMTARIFLHEYDHMIGKTMKERVSKLKWDLATKKYKHKKEKLVKKYTQKTLLDINNQIKSST